MGNKIDIIVNKLKSEALRQMAYRQRTSVVFHKTSNMIASLITLTTIIVVFITPNLYAAIDETNCFNADDKVQNVDRILNIKENHDDEDYSDYDDKPVYIDGTKEGVDDYYYEASITFESTVHKNQHQHNQQQLHSKNQQQQQQQQPTIVVAQPPTLLSEPVPTVNEPSNVKDDKLKKKFETLNLDGGGAKVISHIGALKALMDLGYYTNDRYSFRQIVATSTSCLLGFLVSLDISPVKLETLVYDSETMTHLPDTKLLEFLRKISDVVISSSTTKKSKNPTDQQSSPSSESTPLSEPPTIEPNTSGWFSDLVKSYDIIAQTNRFVESWSDQNSPGLSNEVSLMQFIRNHLMIHSRHIQHFENIETITFADVTRITGHELTCYVTNLSKRSMLELSYNRTPNENILGAVYASMTIPGIYKPTIYEATGDLLIDGSYLNSFPVDLLPKETTSPSSTISISLKNHESTILALAAKRSIATPLFVVPSDRKPINVKSESNKTPWWSSRLTLSNMDTFKYALLLHEFLLSINNDVRSIVDTPSVLETNLPEPRIIALNSPIGTLEYNMTATRISQAINNGYLNTMTHFNML